jgi:hypothetical protein
MIETLMALWNRGVSGRLIVMVVTFFCICISISLLFVTVGGAWGSLFTHGRPGGEETHMVNSALITVTAPTSIATEVATSPVAATPTPTIAPNPCLASPTGARGYSRQVDVTRSKGRTSVPTVKTSAVPAHRRETPPPGVTVTPSPTLPAVTPTGTVTPAATTLPTVTPTMISTPTATATNTPTVGITPTGTSTPGATPTPSLSTPTAGLVPTDTATPGVTPTIMTTPTVTASASSPTATTSATTGMGSRHIDGGGPLPGTPSNVGSGQSGEGNCFSDSLATSGEGAVLSLLQNFLWIILVSSLLGTALFCAQMYRVSRNFRR